MSRAHALLLMVITRHANQATPHPLRLRYFNWKDAPPYGDRADFWGLHTGLYEMNGAPKPARQAYLSTVRQLVAG